MGWLAVMRARLRRRPDRPPDRATALEAARDLRRQRESLDRYSSRGAGDDVNSRPSGYLSGGGP